MDNKVSFHFIGDSHTWIFLEKLPTTVLEMNIMTRKKTSKITRKKTRKMRKIKFETNRLDNYIPFNNEITLFSWRYSGTDGALAYKISKRYETICHIINNYVRKDTDYVCFMTGEIDCRFKINTYAKKAGVSVKDMSIYVARKYIDFIEENYKEYNIIIWGPHAQNNDPSYEYTDGTMEERNIATFHFNNELLRLCNKNNWIYISLFDTMIGPDMKTYDIEKWFLDGVHVNPELAKPFLMKQLLFQLKNRGDSSVFSRTYCKI